MNEENRLLLADRFHKRLLALEPESVLDAGCGKGALLETCRRAGILAFGIEPGPVGPYAGRLGGVRGDAVAMPFRDQEFEWVTLRHVPHHLADPEAAFAEATRVARSGLLVAEPWFDPSFESQRLAAELDGWLKGLDRKRGMVHRECFEPAALVDLFPGEPASVRIETHLELRPIPVKDLEEQAAAAIGDQEIDMELERELDRWRKLVANGELTLNGTVIVELRKPSRDRAA